MVASAAAKRGRVRAGSRGDGGEADGESSRPASDKFAIASSQGPSPSPDPRVSSPATVPSAMRMIRWAYAATCGSWVTKTTVIPSALSC